MVSRVIKTIIIVVVSVSAFSVYQFYFGSGYGGKRYQKEAVNATAKVILNQYYSEQRDSFISNGKYRSDLLSREPYNTYKDYKIGFAKDIPEVAKYCPDCVLLETAFKIGVYTNHDGQDVVWTIDNSGELDNPKSLD